jgi:hypothetical protein
VHECIKASSPKWLPAECVVCDGGWCMVGECMSASKLARRSGSLQNAWWVMVGGTECVMGVLGSLRGDVGRCCRWCMVCNLGGDVGACCGF